jgi:hypothetical protein
MQVTSDTIQIRNAVREDLPLIYSTWLLGLYHGCDWFNRIDKKAFFDNYKKLIEKRVVDSDIKVAVLSDDPDVILGYVCYRNNVLDWIFVKKAWRKMGIAKMIMPTNIDTVTHLTKVGRSLKPKNWVFNPFI